MPHRIAYPAGLPAGLPATVFATLLLAQTGMAAAQVDHPEVEPNGTKPEATALVCLRAGDGLVGVTQGSAALPGDASLGSADTFRLRTCPLPPGIYRHELVLTSAGPRAHSGSLRGRSQWSAAGMPGIVNLGSDIAFQSALPAPDAPPRNAWYGFGRGEELFYRVSGTSATTAPYRATLVSTPIAPVAIPGSLAPGTIVISTLGQGHSTDTDVHLFDADLFVIDDASNDDESGTGLFRQSLLARTLAPGRYHLAVGRFNTATDDNAPADDDFRIGNVLDFPHALAASSTHAGSSVSFSLSDAAGTSVAVQAALPAGEPYGVVWYRFQVGDPPPAPEALCFGDGSGAPCPCGNQGAPGRGCASSVSSAGARLDGTGNASASADTLALVAHGLPNGPALVFQGTEGVATGLGLPFGDGLRCAGGALVRLSARSAQLGALRYPEAGEAPISVRGGCAPGDVRWHQVWYRNAARFCTSDPYNLTNGVRVLWSP